MSLKSDQHYDRRLRRTLSRYGRLKPEIVKRFDDDSIDKDQKYFNSFARCDLNDETNHNQRLVYPNLPSNEDNFNSDPDLNVGEYDLEADFVDGNLNDFLKSLKRTSRSVVDNESQTKTSHTSQADFFADFDDRTYNRLTVKNLKSNQIDFFDKNLVNLYNFNRNHNSGFIWRWTGLKFAKNFARHEALDEPWPIFTYWLIMIQLITMSIMIYSYGFTYFGSKQKEISEIVWHQTNSYQAASYYEHPNIWLGPRYAELIFEGAKFTPCMRPDRNILESIQQRKIEENKSGCCVRHDLDGCVQTFQSKCSNKTSFWIKWSDRPGPVCGEDPEYCDSFDKDFGYNITDWPICLKTNYTRISRSNDYHMKCLVHARPCCVGIYGKCVLASKEYCEFVKGKYHSDASLCSQIDCMKDVCGSLFYPYQLHRLFLPIFMHAGLIQLVINVSIEYVYMRRLEQLLGKFRIIVLFFVSGLTGNLASSIFLPVTPDVGTNAALFGLISFLLYEMFKQRHSYQRPKKVIAKIVCILIILLLPGLFLPFVDFYSIFFGLLSGSFILILIHPREQSKLKKISSIILLTLSLVFLILMFIFADEYLDRIRSYTDLLNCISLPYLNLNCSNIDIAYKEIRALN
ncbi:Inactive rhomboid protein 1 [Sarcoptes scabiei]|uniref:Inactive rhomboid protein 1 n=1 Tax=Sarcoptes scabiei TaxID=52283 RepID=A0A834RBD3_SARSC|nr:Inactive rhomboid protein 1 [Sarcoptes scabiei]